MRGSRIPTLLQSISKTPNTMPDKDSGKPRGVLSTDLPKPEKLSPSLQRIIDKADKDESFYDELYDGT
jgi:fission process protein 1